MPEPVKLPPVGREAVAIFERSLPADPDVVRRLVFGNPAAFVGGQMFFGTFSEDLFVRLGEVDRAEALRLPSAHLFEPMPGRAMTEYVVLPIEIRGDPQRLRSWIDRSVRWARSLPPKAARAKGGAPRRPAAPARSPSRSPQRSSRSR